MLKVLIQLRKFDGGPNIFRQRINQALQKIPDIEVTNSIKDDFDVELSTIRHLGEHSKPRILRVDGCYYRPKQLKQNRDTIKAMKNSKYVIYQSNFSKEMVQNITGYKPKRAGVVHNGIDLSYVDRIQPDNTINPGSFVAAAKWRTNKRPHSMIRGFLEANIDRHLYIIGDHKEIDNKFKKDKRIHFLGPLSTTRTISVMKSCRYLLHLCHIDSCPNTVVEGVASNLNVLCTNLGGSKEIVDDSGVVLDVDKWDFKPRDFSKVDKIDPKTIADGIHCMMDLNPPKRNHLDIFRVAEKYKSILQKEINK